MKMRIFIVEFERVMWCVTAETEDQCVDLLVKHKEDGWYGLKCDERYRAEIRSAVETAKWFSLSDPEVMPSVVVEHIDNY